MFVCKYFKFNDTTEISNKFIAIFTVLSRLNHKKYLIKAIIDIPIQYYFLCQIEEINAVIGQQQIENILMTVKMIEDSNWSKDHISKIKNLAPSPP